MARIGHSRGVGPDGVLVIDKPAGMTSHDVVDRVRCLAGTRRVGHAGTLDPLATGVLVVCLGQATRIAEHLAADRKAYAAGVVFGVETDSQDSAGAVVAERDASSLTRQALERAVEAFRGVIRQVPPMVSAVHHEGRRLYQLARRGIQVERAAREVTIHALDVIAFEEGPRARATLRVECSSGTYIRTLAADLGAAVGTGAMMDSLRRTRSGGFTLEDARSLEELEELSRAGALAGAVLPIHEALAHWPVLAVDGEEERAVSHGRTLRVPVGRLPAAGRVLLVDTTGRALALGSVEGGVVRPEKVFAREGGGQG